MRDLTEVLIKHYGINEGSYDLAIEFQIGTGPVGKTADGLVPGAMIGVNKVGIIESKMVDGVALKTSTTVDAALVNPLKPPRKKKAD